MRKVGVSVDSRQSASGASECGMTPSDSMTELLNVLLLRHGVMVGGYLLEFGPSLSVFMLTVLSVSETGRVSLPPTWDITSQVNNFVIITIFILLLL